MVRLLVLRLAKLECERSRADRELVNLVRKAMKERLERIALHN